MSIDNIQLPISLFQSLFKKNLVDLTVKSGTTATQTGTRIDFLGGNEKNIAFVVHNEHHKFLSDTELKFLSGLINACNVTMADIAVVNFAHNKDVNYKDLLSQLACKKVLSFGVSAANIDLPFTIPDFQVQVFHEIQYIFCPGLELLQEDIDSKKQLWGSLQKIFKIKK